MTIPNFIKLPWHNIAEIMLEIHRLVLLVGDPGCGKTTWALRTSLEKTNKNAAILQGTPETEMSHIWGMYSLKNNETAFCDGPLPQSLKQAKHLIVEEFNLIPLETRASLLTLRGQEQITNPFTGEEIAIPDEFRIIATSNSETLRCRQNSKIAQALLDDFLVLEVPSLQVKQIKKLLRCNFPDSQAEIRNRVVEVWESYSSIDSEEIKLSYRAAAHLMSLLQAGMKESIAVEIALVNKFILNEDAHQAAKLQSSFS